MFKFLKKDKTKTDLDIEIDRIVKKLSGLSPASKHYAEVASNLKLLCEIRSSKKDGYTELDINVIIAALTNIAGILLILNFEHVHVVTSKALGFVLKGRV